MSRGLRPLALVGGVVLACLAPGATALAHASLDDSSPASGAVVATSPDELVLGFDEAVTLDLGGVELSDADGELIEIPAGDVSSEDPSTVTVANLPELEAGVYVVVWQVSSSDGHPARGAFTFQVGTASGAVDSDTLVASALAGRATDTAVSWTLGVARFVAFLGVTVLFGAVAVHMLGGDLRRRRATEQTSDESARLPRHAARVLWWVAWSFAVVGSVAVFVLQGPYLSGGSLADTLDLSLWDDIAGTRLGAAVLVRLALLAISAVLFTRVARGDRTPNPVRLAVWSMVGVAVVVTFSLTGHPSAASPALVGVVVDVLHLAAVAAWIGGLAALLVAADPVERTVRRFSAMATVAVPVIVVTGVVQTWNLAEGIDELTSIAWGRALLVKVSLVVLLVTLGGISRWLLRQDGVSAVRRLVVSELAIGAVVLAVTAGLVATPPTAPPESQVFSATLVQGSLIADVSLTPGRVGSNELHVVFSPPGGTLQPVVSVEARLRSADLPAVPVVLTADGPNHYLGSVQIPSAGEWTLDLEVEPQDNQTVLLSTAIPIP